MATHLPANLHVNDAVVSHVIGLIFETHAIKRVLSVPFPEASPELEIRQMHQGKYSTVSYLLSEITGNHRKSSPESTGKYRKVSESIGNYQ
jgi:hypothetical protein